MARLEIPSIVVHNGSSTPGSPAMDAANHRGTGLEKQGEGDEPPGGTEDKNNQCSTESEEKPPPTRQRSQSKVKLLVRSHAVREEASPPPDPGPAGLLDPQPQLLQPIPLQPCPQQPQQQQQVTSVSAGDSLRPTTGSRSHKLRHQGSSQGSGDSCPSPGACLSRDSSTEQAPYTDSSGVDLQVFLADTLNRSTKDRQKLFQVEQELVSLARDNKRTHHKFPPMSSYNRMLVHRAAAYYGLEHNVDPSGSAVIVNRTRGTRVPETRFRDLLLAVSTTSTTQGSLSAVGSSGGCGSGSRSCSSTDGEPTVPVGGAGHTVNSGHIFGVEEPRRSILKRDSASFEDTFKSPERQLGCEPPRRSKSFEEREEEYERARQRIFHHHHQHNHPSHNNHHHRLSSGGTTVSPCSTSGSGSAATVSHEGLNSEDCDGTINSGEPDVESTAVEDDDDDDDDEGGEDGDDDDDIDGGDWPHHGAPWDSPPDGSFSIATDNLLRPSAALRSCGGSQQQRLLKVESFEGRDTLKANSLRLQVSKSYSFGGYPGAGAQSAATDAGMGAGPRMLLTKQDSASSSVSSRLSPSTSSGYKSQSQRSDATLSATPSPTATPTGGVSTILDSHPLQQSPTVMWAVTSMAAVPPGSMLINPQTGQPLKNPDGSIYHWDPANPPLCMDQCEITDTKTISAVPANWSSSELGKNTSQSLSMQMSQELPEPQPQEKQQQLQCSQSEEQQIQKQMKHEQHLHCEPHQESQALEQQQTILQLSSQPSPQHEGLVQPHSPSHTQLQPVHSHTQQIHSQTQHVHSQTQHVHSQTQHVHSQTQHVHSQTQQIHSQTQHVQPHTQHVLPQTQQVHSQTQYIQSQSQQIQAQTQQVQAQAQQVQSQTQQVHSQNQQVQSQNQQVQSQNQQVQSQNQQVQSQNQQVQSQNQQVQSQTQQVQSQNQQVHSQAQAQAQAQQVHSQAQGQQVHSQTRQSQPESQSQLQVQNQPPFTKCGMQVQSHIQTLPQLQTISQLEPQVQIPTQSQAHNQVQLQIHSKPPLQPQLQVLPHNQVQPHNNQPQHQSQTHSQTTAQSKVQPLPQSQPQLQLQPQPQPQLQPQPQAQQQPQAHTQSRHHSRPHSRTQSQQQSQAQNQPEHTIQNITDLHLQNRPEIQAQTMPDCPVQTLTECQAQTQTPFQTQTQLQPKIQPQPQLQVQPQFLPQSPIQSHPQPQVPAQTKPQAHHHHHHEQQQPLPLPKEPPLAQHQSSSPQQNQDCTKKSLSQQNAVLQSPNSELKTHNVSAPSHHSQSHNVPSHVHKTPEVITTATSPVLPTATSPQHQHPAVLLSSSQAAQSGMNAVVTTIAGNNEIQTVAAVTLPLHGQACAVHQYQGQPLVSTQHGTGTELVYSPQPLMYMPDLRTTTQPHPSVPDTAGATLHELSGFFMGMTISTQDPPPPPPPPPPPAPPPPPPLPPPPPSLPPSQQSQPPPPPPTQTRSNSFSGPNSGGGETSSSNYAVPYWPQQQQQQSQQRQAAALYYVPAVQGPVQVPGASPPSAAAAAAACAAAATAAAVASHHHVHHPHHRFLTPGYPQPPYGPQGSGPPQLDGRQSGPVPPVAVSGTHSLVAHAGGYMATGYHPVAGPAYSSAANGATSDCGVSAIYQPSPLPLYYPHPHPATAGQVPPTAPTPPHTPTQTQALCHPAAGFMYLNGGYGAPQPPPQPPPSGMFNGGTGHVAQTTAAAPPHPHPLLPSLHVFPRSNVQMLSGVRSSPPPRPRGPSNSGMDQSGQSQAHKGHGGMYHHRHGGSGKDSHMADTKNTSQQQQLQHPQQQHHHQPHHHQPQQLGYPGTLPLIGLRLLPAGDMRLLGAPLSSGPGGHGLRMQFSPVGPPGGLPMPPASNFGDPIGGSGRPPRTRKPRCKMPLGTVSGTIRNPQEDRSNPGPKTGAAPAPCC